MLWCTLITLFAGIHWPTAKSEGLHESESESSDYIVCGHLDLAKGKGVDLWIAQGQVKQTFFLLIFFNIPQRNKISQIFLAINLRSRQIFQVRIIWLQKARRGLEEKKEDKDKEARWRTAAARERMVGKRSIGVPTSCTVRGRTCTVPTVPTCSHIQNLYCSPLTLTSGNPTGILRIILNHSGKGKEKCETLESVKE